MRWHLCRRRNGLSGYVRRTADGGWEDMPCRCVTDKRDRDLYGSTRHRMAMLRALAALGEVAA